MKIHPRHTKEFHAHLDVCQQCANHPFELCAAGRQLLITAGAPTAELSSRDLKIIIASLAITDDVIAHGSVNAILFAATAAMVTALGQDKFRALQKRLMETVIALDGER